MILGNLFISMITFIFAYSMGNMVIILKDSNTEKHELCFISNKSFYTNTPCVISAKLYKNKRICILYVGNDVLFMCYKIIDYFLAPVSRLIYLIRKYKCNNLIWRNKCWLLLLELQEILLLMSMLYDMQGHVFVPERCWFAWGFISNFYVWWVCFYHLFFWLLVCLIAIFITYWYYWSVKYITQYTLMTCSTKTYNFFSRMHCPLSAPSYGLFKLL